MGPALLGSTGASSKNRSISRICRARHRPRYKALAAASALRRTGKSRALFASACASAVQLARRRFLRRHRASARRRPAPRDMAVSMHPRSPRASASMRWALLGMQPFHHPPVQRDDTLARDFAQRRPARAAPAAISSGDGAKMRLAASIWPGWIRVLPSKPKRAPWSQAAANPSSSSMRYRCRQSRPGHGRAPPAPSGSWPHCRLRAVGHGPAAHLFHQIIGAQHQAVPRRRRRWRPD